MQQAETGHFSVNIYGKQYNLVASLENMAKIASSKRILNIYDMMHSKIVPNSVLIDVARNVLMACCDDPSLDEHLVRIRRGKPLLKHNTISVNDQVVVAASLLRHGIAGVNKPKSKATPKKGQAEPLRVFDVNKIVADAMIHFDLSRAEAMQLTMSDFYHLLAAKYPPEKRSKDLSLEAHIAAMNGQTRY